MENSSILMMPTYSGWHGVSASTSAKSDVTFNILFFLNGCLVHSHSIPNLDLIEFKGG